MQFQIRMVAIGVLLAMPASVLAQDRTVTFFKETCGICHGEAGEGMKGLAPPLKGNDWVKSASEGDLATVITKGRQGDAKRHKDIPGPMPANSMSDSRLKAVIGYIKGDLQK